MKKIETKVLFHPSAMGQIMTNAQGKSNAQKWHEAIANLDKMKAKQLALDSKLKLINAEITSLESEKDNEIPSRKNAKSPAEKYRLATSIKLKIEAEIFENTFKIEEQEINVFELEQKKDVPTLSSTCKKMLKTMAIEVRYNRRKRLENKYTKKGTIQEDESIQLYGDCKGESFENNKKRAENNWFTGEWDIEVLDSKKNIVEVIDIKTRFDIDSYEDNRDEEMQAKDKYQLLSYCDLLNVEKATIANVLTNTHDEGIMDEIRRETYNIKADDLQGFDVPMVRVLEILKDNIFDQESYEMFIENFYSKMVLKALSDKKPNVEMKVTEEAMYEFHSFVEVPLDERIIEVSIDKDNEEIEKMKKRIEDCRAWMAEKYNIHHAE